MCLHVWSSIYSALTVRLFYATVVVLDEDVSFCASKYRPSVPAMIAGLVRVYLLQVTSRLRNANYQIHFEVEGKRTPFGYILSDTTEIAARVHPTVSLVSSRATSRSSFSTPCFQTVRLGFHRRLSPQPMPSRLAKTSTSCTSNLSNTSPVHVFFCFAAILFRVRRPSVRGSIHSSGFSPAHARRHDLVRAGLQPKGTATCHACPHNMHNMAKNHVKHERL